MIWSNRKTYLNYRLLNEMAINMVAFQTVQPSRNWNAESAWNDLMPRPVFLLDAVVRGSAQASAAVRSQAAMDCHRLVCLYLIHSYL